MSALATELGRISAWLIENVDKVGTVEFRKANLTHRLLTELVNNDTPARRAIVATRLAEIERGEGLGTFPTRAKHE